MIGLARSCSSLMPPHKIMTVDSAPIFLTRAGCLHRAIRPVDAQTGLSPAHTPVSRIAKEQLITYVLVPEEIQLASPEGKLRTIDNSNATRIILGGLGGFSEGYTRSSTICGCCRMLLAISSCRPPMLFVQNAAPGASDNSFQIQGFGSGGFEILRTSMWVTSILYSKLCPKVVYRPYIFHMKLTKVVQTRKMIFSSTILCVEMILSLWYAWLYSGFTRMALIFEILITLCT